MKGCVYRTAFKPIRTPHIHTHTQKPITMDTDCVARIRRLKIVKGMQRLPTSGDAGHRIPCKK
jgi:hypothetical protein